MSGLEEQARVAGWHPWQRRLHWITAALMTITIAIILYIIFYPELPETERGTWLWNMQFWLLNIHYILGLTILATLVLRVILRMKFGAPPLPDHIPGWQQKVAHLVHVLLYINTSYMVIAGYLLIDAGGYYIWWNLFEWPVFDPDRDYNREMIFLMKDMKFWGAMGLLVLLPLHIGAALKHHFVDRDDVLRRMLPKKLGGL